MSDAAGQGAVSQARGPLHGIRVVELGGGLARRLLEGGAFASAGLARG